MQIKVKKGLDIPLAGGPEGSPHPLPPPDQVALNLDPFDTTRFKVHVKVGERVKIGQPLVESKTVPGQMFVSPAGGTVSEVRRGLKRRLLDIVIDVEPNEEYYLHEKCDLQSATQRELLDLFMRSGLFPHVRLRPFNLVPDPQYIPRDIFVTAAQSLPFVPPFSMQVEGNEKYFQAGLDTLAKLTTGKVHLVHPQKEEAFSSYTGVEKHTVLGPHPSGTSSLHIHKIAPIQAPNDYVWALTALDVLVIGKMLLEGKYYTDRIISIAGTGVIEGRRGFFRARMGFPIQNLISNRITNQPVRLISGDPLTGTKTEASDFLGFYDTCFSALLENTKRQFLHFFRLGLNKFTATRAYLTGHVSSPENGFAFTTNQHGEQRAFIDGAVYERVMPMRIPTMHLIKAIMAEDYELAEQLGLLEVVPDDFALSTFICPSKIEMIEIVKEGLYRYSKEVH